MRTVYYVVIESIFDPRGTKIRGVRHVEDEAEKLMLCLKQQRANDANIRRRNEFEKGYECGRHCASSDFDQFYEIREVPE